MNRQLSKGWNAWVYAARLRRKTVIAVARMRLVAVVKAFNKWAGRTDGDHARRERLVAHAKRLKHARDLVPALNVLKEGGRQRYLMRRAGAGISKRGLKKGFNAWLEATELAHERRRLLTAAVSGFRDAAILKAFNAWVERVTEPDPMAAALARWSNSALTYARTRTRACREGPARHTPPPCPASTATGMHGCGSLKRRRMGSL